MLDTTYGGEVVMEQSSPPAEVGRGVSRAGGALRVELLRGGAGAGQMNKQCCSLPRRLRRHHLLHPRRG